MVIRKDVLVFERNNLPKKVYYVRKVEVFSSIQIRSYQVASSDAVSNSLAVLDSTSLEDVNLYVCITVLNLD